MFVSSVIFLFIRSFKKNLTWYPWMCNAVSITVIHVSQILCTRIYKWSKQGGMQSKKMNQTASYVLSWKCHVEKLNCILETRQWLRRVSCDNKGCSSDCEHFFKHSSCQLSSLSCPFYFPSFAPNTLSTE